MQSYVLPNPSVGEGSRERYNDREYRFYLPHRGPHEAPILATCPDSTLRDSNAESSVVELDSGRALKSSLYGRQTCTCDAGFFEQRFSVEKKPPLSVLMEDATVLAGGDTPWELDREDAATAFVL